MCWSVIIQNRQTSINLRIFPSFVYTFLHVIGCCAPLKKKKIKNMKQNNEKMYAIIGIVFIQYILFIVRQMFCAFSPSEQARKSLKHFFSFRKNRISKLLYCLMHVSVCYHVYWQMQQPFEHVRRYNFYFMPVCNVIGRHYSMAKTSRKKIPQYKSYAHITLQIMFHS